MQHERALQVPAHHAPCEAGPTQVAESAWNGTLILPINVSTFGILWTADGGASDTDLRNTRRISSTIAAHANCDVGRGAAHAR